MASYLPVFIWRCAQLSLGCNINSSQLRTVEDHSRWPFLVWSSGIFRFLLVVSGLNCQQSKLLTETFNTGHSQTAEQAHMFESQESLFIFSPVAHNFSLTLSYYWMCFVWPLSSFTQVREEAALIKQWGGCCLGVIIIKGVCFVF